MKYTYTLRTLLIIGLALAGMWFSAGVTHALIFNDASVIAGKFHTSRGDAIAARNLLITEAAAPSRAAQREARMLAQRALKQSPVEPIAIEALAGLAILDGNIPAAREAYRFSESLSRRELPTQLWLIEDAVAANDIPRVLRHYDRALRVHPAAYEFLFPIMLNASIDPAVAKPLSAVLASRPSWWRVFSDQLIATGPSDDAVVEIATALKLNPDDETDRGLLTTALRRLISRDRIADAARLFEASDSGHRSGRGLRDGDFEADGGLSPFDWQLSDQQDLYATRSVRPDGRDGLALILSTNGARGVLASQLVPAMTGDVTLRVVVGGIEGYSSGRFVAEVRCSNIKGDALLALPLVPAKAGATAQLNGTLTVPQSCSALLLNFTTGDGLGASEPSQIWVDNVRLD